MKYRVGQLVARVNRNNQRDLGYISRIVLDEFSTHSTIYFVDWLTTNDDLSSNVELAEWHIDSFRKYFEFFFQDIMGANNENQA